MNVLLQRCTNILPALLMDGNFCGWAHLQRCTQISVVLSSVLSGGIFSGCSFSSLSLTSNSQNTASNVCEVSPMYLLWHIAEIIWWLSCCFCWCCHTAPAPFHYLARLGCFCWERKLKQSEAQYIGAIKMACSVKVTVFFRSWE